VVSPKNLEASELQKSDFEILSIAMVLCNTARSDDSIEVCGLGDVNVESFAETGNEQLISGTLQSFDLDRAIADGRVSANYQPWVYVASDDGNSIKGIYDVRIEFIDTRGNAVSQNALVKLLDSAAARGTVDRWVLRNTVNRLRELADSGDGNDIKLSVKVSLSSLADASFTAWLKVLLREMEVRRGRLLIEIDAGQFLRDPKPYSRMLEDIGAEFGIKSVLSGINDADRYCEVQKLQHFDFVKLNVTRLAHNKPHGPLRVLLGKVREDLSLVVAVNVADAEMLALASAFGVDYMHGYLIGRPNTDIIADSEGDLYCVI
jgi:EAL domain-containing protein (putative c-di-GMP-specific phosphodiesterase class I)